MTGDDRARFCGSCSKHVYNIAGLTAAEAVSLIEQAEGGLCVRLHRRKDGTVLTADCPVGLRHAVRRRLVRLATAGAVLFLTLRSGVWLYGSGLSLPNIPPPPAGPGVTLSDVKDWASDVIGLRRQRVYAGFICVPMVPDARSTNPEGHESISADQF